MSDVVVTVPKSFGWGNWIEEGDAAGDPATGETYSFSVPACPKIEPGERVYVVFNGRLRGYAPLIHLIRLKADRYHGRRFLLIRGGGAVALTVPARISGFQGFRYRWWDREIEVPFPEWRTP